jgi:hypothetical protein
MKLIAPGKRKGNKFWLARGNISGNDMEVSTKTIDEEEAKRFLEKLQIAAAADLAITLRPRLQPIEVVFNSVDPVECGVYFLWLLNSLQYVGQSYKIPARIARHCEERRIHFNAWTAIACHENELDFVEAAYIHQFNPPINKGFSRGRRNYKSEPRRGNSQGILKGAVDLK